MSAQPSEIPEHDYTLTETAQALRVSTRWVRDRIKAGDKGEGPFVEHIRRGNKIMFTAAQLEKLRATDAKTPPVVESITTGKKRRTH